eukprot:scaffold237666_cov33-Tisochrysis_lutea.AAC.5
MSIRRSAMSHSRIKSVKSPRSPGGCAPPVRSSLILMAGSGPGATVTHAESSCATYLWARGRGRPGEIRRGWREGREASDDDGLQ